MRSMGASSYTSKIVIAGGKENNVRECLSNSDDLVDLCSDEEDDREPAAGLLPSESGFTPHWVSSASHRTTTAGGQGNDHRKPAAKRAPTKQAASTAGRRTTTAGGQGNDHRKPAAKRAPTKQAASTSTATFASATNIPTNKRKLTQSLIVKVKISDYTMKQDLGVGDTLPTTMAEIQAANWFAQGSIKYVIIFLTPHNPHTTPT